MACPPTHRVSSSLADAVDAAAAAGGGGGGDWRAVASSSPTTTTCCPCWRCCSTARSRYYSARASASNYRSAAAVAWQVCLSFSLFCSVWLAFVFFFFLAWQNNINTERKKKSDVASFPSFYFVLFL